MFAKDFIWQMCCGQSTIGRYIHLINKLLAKYQHFIVVSLERLFFLVFFALFLNVVHESCYGVSESVILEHNDIEFWFTTKTHFSILLKLIPIAPAIQNDFVSRN